MSYSFIRRFAKPSGWAGPTGWSDLSKFGDNNFSTYAIGWHNSGTSSADSFACQTDYNGDLAIFAEDYPSDLGRDFRGLQILLKLEVVTGTVPRRIGPDYATATDVGFDNSSSNILLGGKDDKWGATGNEFFTNRVSIKSNWGPTSSTSQQRAYDGYAIIHMTDVATLSTNTATSKARTSFTGNSNITDTGGLTVTKRGFCYLEGTTGTPTTSDSVAYDDGSFGEGAFSKSITGLTENTSYRVRPYGVNSFGTAYGSTITVTTLTDAVVETTESIISRTSTTITIGGNITTTGNETNSRGICYKLASVSGNPTTSDSKVFDTGDYPTGTFSKQITGLTSGQRYKCRAYVVNNLGTYYGLTYIYAPLGWLNPTNAYSSDDTYATILSTDGKIDVQLSVNNGSTFTSAKTATLPTGSGSEGSVILGSNGDTWGLSIDGDKLEDGTFSIRVAPNSSPTGNEQEYRDFSFSVSSTYRITGIEVKLEGYYDDSADIIYLDWIAVQIWYGNTVTPVTEGSMAYASDGRKNSEGVGAGSGVTVFWDGSDWIAVDTGAQVDD